MWILENLVSKLSLKPTLADMNGPAEDGVFHSGSLNRLRRPLNVIVCLPVTQKDYL